MKISPEKPNKFLDEKLLNLLRFGKLSNQHILLFVFHIYFSNVSHVDNPLIPLEKVKGENTFNPLPKAELQIHTVN